MKEILTTYSAYNLWANKRIVEMLKENISLLDKEIKSSFPSLRKTVFHIWGCEELWRKRMHRESLAYVPNMDFKDGFEEAAEKFITVSSSFNDFVSLQNDSFFLENCTYKDTRGSFYTHPHWWMIHHCMNHSTFHRGQIITILRELGVTKILATDLIVFLREKSS